jgi:hypothetical protein
MAKVLCVLYDDPVDGYHHPCPGPDSSITSSGAKHLRTPTGSTSPLGHCSASGELGLRTFLGAQDTRSS